MLRNTLHLIAVAIALTIGVVSTGYAQDSEPAQAETQKIAAPAQDKAPAAAPAQDGAAESPAQQKGAQQNNAKALQPSQTDNNTAGQPAAASAPDASLADKPKVSTEAIEPKKTVWPFEGMNGYVDKQATQRGFQIYSQVCSVCHSMNLVAYRSLSDIGFSDAEIKAIASQKQVDDTDDNGQRIQRPGKPFDHFVPPYPNEKASRAANNGSYPPDLSLIVKAREYGPDYVYSLLTGFGTTPPDETPVEGKYYNPYFQGHWISMPPPLRDGTVTYQDGTNANIDQMARDVVTFLQWAAEPEMQERHEMGIKVLIFLLITAIVFYIAKKRVWKNIK
jgi:ubiquinol-cytochrome c reductase cytochrome c1 subunit